MLDSYVYGYLDDNDTLYYVGKGVGNRCYSKDHNVKVPKNRDKIIFFYTNVTDFGAEILECQLIKKYGRKGIDEGGFLLNVCLGNNPPNLKGRHPKHWLGKKQSKEMIEKRVKSTDQKEKQKTKEKTMLERYGVKSSFELKDTKEAIAKTHKCPQRNKKISETLKANYDREDYKQRGAKTSEKRKMLRERQIVKDYIKLTDREGVKREKNYWSFDDSKLKKLISDSK